MSRYRTRSVQGYATASYNSNQYDIYPTVMSEYCRDTIGNRNGVNWLELEKFLLIEGSINDGGFFNVSGAPDVVRHRTGFHSVSTPLNNQATTNRLLANGPAKPDIYLPVSIFELKDIPSMLKHAGDLLHKLKRPSGLTKPQELASANLAYQFGWRPLLDDIFTMFKFQEMMDKRKRKLMRAASTDGLRSRVTVGSGVETEGGSAVVNSTWGFYLSLPFVEERSYTEWATCRWHMREGVDIGHIMDHHGDFRNVIGGGLGAIPINVWKALPWSWIIDWFSNLSHILEANRNLIDFQPSMMAAMRSYETNRVFEPHPNTGNSSIVVRGTRKTRSVLTSNRPYPTLKLPLIDNFRAGILSSLLVLRMERK
uniref:Maturation protein n=1 Tax=Beihai levi-like virus 3 TaxID=1922416 RepID=A0A1L3KI02_9VIRU|nr:hypothetical protein [Beihai levi-like virus 3]